MVLPQHSFERPKFILRRHLYVLEFVVPAGFVTDAATTPRLLWPLFPPVGKWTESAILHDYLLTKKDRDYADRQFFRALREHDHVHVVPARLMWLAVRARSVHVITRNWVTGGR